MRSLTPEAIRVLAAYRRGIFPMADGPQGKVSWFRTSRRGIITLPHFHTPRRLLRTVRSNRFRVSFDRDFPSVIAACARPRHSTDSTWINDEIRNWYTELHLAGYAHSVEAWDGENMLVGGVYGVALGGFFAGESMFHIRRDAGKVALIALLDHLARQGFVLFDTQFHTKNLAQFGCVEIPEGDYLVRLAAAVQMKVSF